ncbi:MAG: Nif3-like dinuclear metal center hexameric protein [candidate division KSB1 bacterium]|nr:Nif3-like dinuclear metal center hexameric protein [candidate division KSB1 bacterium]
MKTVQRDDVIRYLNEYLEIENFQDFTPKGIHVEGKETVGKIVTGVSCNADLIDAAIEEKADMVIVHHGILWDKESHVVKGVLKGRLQKLLKHDITLLAYHLPLDAHRKIGNNAAAAQLLGMTHLEPFGGIGLRGRIHPVQLNEFVQLLKKIYSSEPLSFAYGPETIETIAVCSGGAQKLIAEALEMGVDAFVTGEVSEPVMHLAKEGKLHFFSMGHHASERLGIQRLGGLVAKKFDIIVSFVDIDNPV